MSSVIKYWKGRLEDVCPFHDKKYLKDEAYAQYVTLAKGTWPAYISQRALYSDYCEWFSAVITAQLNLDVYNVNEMPSPVHVRDFNANIKAFLSCGNDAKTWNRRVPVPRNFQGSWFDEQKFQRFWKLYTWKEHAEAYSAITGTEIDLTNARKMELTGNANHAIVP